MPGLQSATALHPSAAFATGPAAWFVHDRTVGSHFLQVDLAGLTELLGGKALDSTLAPLDRFQIQRVAGGTTLIHEGASATTLYVVQVGSFKCVKTAEDGYEHVLAFALRRDLLGCDGLAGERYAFAAVALEDSRVVALPQAGLAELRRRVHELDKFLQARIARHLAHAGEIAELMAAVAAEVRLARFLVQLSARMAEHGQSPRRLLLRMSRRDIANHLGLAHETISRSFRVLAERGWLLVDDRDVEIIDLDGLRTCARHTRGLADKTPGPLRSAWTCAA